jgi:hypothetical protein
MTRQIFIIVFILFTGLLSGQELSRRSGDTKINPLELDFHRLAVRRFIFSNNINLCEFVPSEIVSFPSMHPAFLTAKDNTPLSDSTFQAKIVDGNLIFDQTTGNTASICVGGVNPYATYEIDILATDATGSEFPEIGIELARLGLRDKIQVIAKTSGKERGIYLRIYRNAVLDRETKYSDTIPEGDFKLRIQLYGHTLGIFTEKKGVTTYIGHLPKKENFGDVLDFRKTEILKECTFNMISNLQGTVVVGGARSCLSTGIGQADIRLISYEDLSPVMDDGRLWFTFSCRGIDTSQAAQGVLSMDPSVFDIKFEGMIVFDHGDGLLRNDYASHLFFDRNADEWRAYTCDFGGSAGIDGRYGSGLVTATSSRDPRRGFSVMQAIRVENDKIGGHNEDPCIFYNRDSQKWILLTSAFVNNNITSRTCESDTWDGKFTPVALPISLNSTGTSVQKVGDTYFAFMGGNGNLRVHAFPDLTLLGELKLDLQPHWPKPAGRVWASLAPLPRGYPYKYVLLTMDRPNFPGIKTHNWSYGALYFYGVY